MNYINPWRGDDDQADNPDAADAVTATYTLAGHILVDDIEIDTYDADGGTWENEVRDVLRRHGYEPIGQWHADGYDSLITVRDLDQ